jgi:hypothetical protein
VRPALLRCTLLVLTAAAAAPGAAAQSGVPPAPLTLAGGQLHYTQGATRNGALLALRLASPLAPLGVRRWLLEPGVSYGWYRGDAGQRRHVFVAELQLQAQSGTAPLQPYLGVGGGFGLTRVDSATSARLTLSASAGLRWSVLDDVGVVGELRLRRLAFFQGWARELTAGLYAPIR